MAHSGVSISFGHNNHGLQIGQNFGSVSTEIHLPPERTEAPPSPSSNVPFRRDPDFVDRGDLVERLHSRLSLPAARAVLTGLGGTGKSQLAIEYTYRFREQWPDAWVLWVHASNPGRFQQSLKDAADHLRIPGRDSPSADVEQLIYERLNDAGKTRWLLILDNADEANYLFDLRSVTIEGVRDAKRPLIDCFPRCTLGSMIITTRRRTMASQFADEQDIIDIPPMDEKHAIELLSKKIGYQEETSKARELLAELDYMPLAIAQAGSYIKQRAPRCSIREYLNILRRSYESRTNLMSHNFKELRRDWEANDSIISTWQISFEHVRHARQSAADLLSLMSFFDRQGIPECLLHDHPDEWVKHNSAETAEGSAPRDGEFEDDVVILCDYSFIECNPSGEAFEMHRLVQLATQEWLRAHQSYQDWEEQSLRRLDLVLPNGEYENWKACQMFYPHARKMLELKPQRLGSAIERASVLYKAAWYARTRGSIAEAEELAACSVSGTEEIFGAEDVRTLATKVLLLYTYLDQHRWKEAEQLGVQTVAVSRELLGEDDTRTLTSIDALATCYSKLGQSSKAVEMGERCWEIVKTTFGEDHQAALALMGNLVRYYNDLGEKSKAAEMGERCWEMRKRKLGEDHPNTLVSMEWHIQFLRSKGRTSSATKLLEDCVKSSIETLGEDHQITKKRISYLRALQSEREVISAQKLGEHHLDITRQACSLEEQQSQREAIPAKRGLRGMLRRLRE